MAEGFAVGAWIERLAELLPPLARVQESFLREDQERYGRVIELRHGGPPRFPLDELRLLYDQIRDSRPWGLETHYAPLRAVLNPVRHALLRAGRFRISFLRFQHAELIPYDGRVVISLGNKC